MLDRSERKKVRTANRSAGTAERASEKSANVAAVAVLAVGLSRFVPSRPTTRPRAPPTKHVLVPSARLSTTSSPHPHTRYTLCYVPVPIPDLSPTVGYPPRSTPKPVPAFVSARALHHGLTIDSPPRSSSLLSFKMPISRPQQHHKCLRQACEHVVTRLQAVIRRDLLKHSLRPADASSDFELLEFLGDAALGYRIAKMLAQTKRFMSPHGLSLLKQSLTKNATLARVFDLLNINALLAPEHRRSADVKPRADVIEAIIGELTELLDKPLSDPPADRELLQSTLDKLLMFIAFQGDEEYHCTSALLQHEPPTAAAAASAAPAPPPPPAAPKRKQPKGAPATATAKRSSPPTKPSKPRPRSATLATPATVPSLAANVSDAAVVAAPAESTPTTAPVAMNPPTTPATPVVATAMAASWPPPAVVAAAAAPPAPKPQRSKPPKPKKPIWPDSSKLAPALPCLFAPTRASHTPTMLALSPPAFFSRA